MTETCFEIRVLTELGDKLCPTDCKLLCNEPKRGPCERYEAVKDNMSGYGLFESPVHPQTEIFRSRRDGVRWIRPARTEE